VDPIEVRSRQQLLLREAEGTLTCGVDTGEVAVAAGDHEEVGRIREELLEVLLGAPVVRLVVEREQVTAGLDVRLRRYHHPSQRAIGAEDRDLVHPGLGPQAAGPDGAQPGSRLGWEAVVEPSSKKRLAVTPKDLARGLTHRPEPTLIVDDEHRSEGERERRL